MPDLIDRAADVIELEMRARLAAVRQRTGIQLEPNGICHNCSCEVDGPRLFCKPLEVGCESECQADYEHRHKRRV